MVLLNKIKNKLRLNYRKKRWPGLIEAYKQYLPVTKKTPIISLNEGNTPLILSETISNLIGCLLYTSPSPRDVRSSRMPSSA